MTLASAWLTENAPLPETIHAALAARVTVVPRNDSRHQLLTLAQLDAIRVLALLAAEAPR